MSSAVNRAIILTLGIIISIWLAYSVFSSHGNTLGQFAQKVAIIGFFTGLFLPRGAMFFLFVSFFYSDVLKRLLIVDRVYGWDIVSVLAITPMIMLGMTINFLYKLVVGKEKLTKRFSILIMIAVMANLLTAAISLKQGYGMMNAMKSIANSSAGTVLLFLVPSLFPTREDFLKLCRVLVITCIPCAIYGVFQRYNGILPFERAYLESGFTITVEQLEYEASGKRPRPFSTLNHHGTYGLISAICFLLSSLSFFSPKRGIQSLKKLPFNKIFGIMTLIIFGVATIHSFARTSWILIIMALFAGLFFRSKKTLLLGYATIVSLLLTLIVSSELIVEEDYLMTIEKEMRQMFDIESGDDLQQAFRVTTYGSRINGYANTFGNAEAWTFFGLGKDEYLKLARTQGASHDLLSNILIKYGAIPMFFMLGLLSYVLYRTHKFMLSISHKHESTRTNLLFAIPVATFICSTFSGNILTIFPVSQLLFLILGGLIVFTTQGYLDSKKDLKVQKAKLASLRQSFWKGRSSATS